jgi:cytochrome c556
MNRLTRIGVAVALAAATSLAFSQAPPGAGGPGPGGGAPNPEAQAKTAIDNRQAIFKLIGSQNGPLGGINRANAPAPDLAVVARNAARIQTLADMIPEMFTANPTAPATVKTRALPAIWTGQADFKAKAEALSKAAGATADAAKKGDLAATKAAAADMAKACQTCHETYRGPAVQ